MEVYEDVLRLAAQCPLLWFRREVQASAVATAMNGRTILAASYRFARYTSNVRVESLSFALGGSTG